MTFDLFEFRKHFPQLARKMGPNHLVYFDSGASSLKHSDVTDRLNSYNRFETSNVHRGAHHLSRQATEAYEGSRQKIKKFINAQSDQEVIFTRGTTEGINLIAYCLQNRVTEGDEILITPFEHHSNIVPWQVLCQKTGATLKVAPFDRKKGMTAEMFVSALNVKTKVASMVHYSNSFGQRLPVEEMLLACKQQGVLTLLDSAQAVLSENIDVQKLGCDFLCFSGHKIFGPYGIGVLYIKSPHFDEFPPYQTGGSMIDRVEFDKTTYALSPQKFEAGTPNISGAIGLGSAVDVIKKMDFQGQHNHVLKMRQLLLSELSYNPLLEVYDFPSSDYSGALSFNFKGAHCSDVGTILDKYGIAVRAGHHCTQPLMDLLGIPGTVRISLAAYNSEQEVNYFLEILKKVEGFFQ